MKGRLSKEAEDRPKIESLVNILEKHMKPVVVGYVGDYDANGVKNGRGVYTYDDGDVYKGEMKDGLKHGRGVYYFADANIYDGEWLDDFKNGHGKFTFSDGTVWEGEFRNDLRVGVDC